MFKRIMLLLALTFGILLLVLTLQSPDLFKDWKSREHSREKSIMSKSHGTPRLNPGALAIIQRLRNDPADARTIHELADQLYFYGPSGAEVYAPLVLPTLLEALDGMIGDVEHDQLRIILSCLGQSAVSSLPKLIHNKRVGVRQAAAEAAAEMGRDAASAADALVSLLEDPEPEVRGQACNALAAVRPNQESAKLLIARLDDPSIAVRYKAIDALGPIGEEAAEAVTPLMRFVDANGCRNKAAIGSGLCYHALRSMTNLSLSPRHLNRLRPLLQRDWQSMKDNLLASLELGSLTAILGKMGPAARECLPDLESLLRLDDETITPTSKTDVASAVLKIDGSNYLAGEILRHYADSKNHSYRYFVIQGLADLPPNDQVRFLGVIEKMAKDSDREVREIAQKILSGSNLNKQ